MTSNYLEQMRQNDRVMRKTQRDIARDRTDLERQEKKLVNQIITCMA